LEAVVSGLSSVQSPLPAARGLAVAGSDGYLLNFFFIKRSVLAFVTGRKRRVCKLQRGRWSRESR
jgi:hypothetical protein